MKKAVFLDRDGILIKEKGDYTWREEEAEIVDGVIEALKKIEQKGYLMIVITNQSGISKGIYKKDHVWRIHKMLQGFLKAEGVIIKDIFWCPHHPTVSKCLCRKPDSLMLEKAMAMYDINARVSYFIGDMERDVEAGIKAGLTPVHVPSNSDLNEYLHLIA